MATSIRRARHPQWVAPRLFKQEAKPNDALNPSIYQSAIWKHSAEFSDLLLVVRV